MKGSQGRSGPADPNQAALGPLARAARRAADAGVPAAPSPLEWERLQRTRARRARAARLRIAGAAVAGLLLAVGGVGGELWLGRARDISYRVDGAALGEGGYIDQIAGRGARLQFSEGTKVELEAGTRASVVSSGPEGARLRLESGRAHFEVVHRPRSRWSVDAGPFSIAVTGTVFDVKWAGADELLEVSLLRGAVTVRGPLAGEGVTLRPGQRLVSHLRERQLRIEDLAPAGTGAVAVPAARGAPVAPVAPGAAGALLPPVAPVAPPIAPAAVMPVNAPPSGSASATQAAAYRRLVSHLNGRSLSRSLSLDGAAPRGRAAGAIAIAAEPASGPAAPLPGTRGAPAAFAPAARNASAAIGPLPVVVARSPSGAPPAAAEPPPASPAPPPAPAEREAPASWPQRVAKGDFRGVLEEAERYGIGACVTDCDRAALAALADAARYAGSSDVARRALLAARQRFSGSPSAQAAAFLLGRMADQDGQTPREALAWYERYLDEAPDGAYAAEALGRKMLVVNRLEGRVEAGKIAALYLRRFPNGSYISQATILLRNP